MKSISKGYNWSTEKIIGPPYNQTTDFRKLRQKLGMCVSCNENKVPGLPRVNSRNPFWTKLHQNWYSLA